MTIPSRWQELSAVILDRFQGIRVADGYQTNLGMSVHEWRTAAVDPENETDVLNVRQSDEVIQDTIGEDHHRLRVRCELIVVGEDAPTRIKAARADVLKAISTDLTWGGLAEHTSPGETSELQLDHASRKVIGLVVEFIVHYVTAPWSAYV